MAVSNLKVGTFGDWIGLFNDWRKEIGVDHDDIRGFHFDTLFGAIETDDIQFGHWKGRKKWENLRQVPTQQIRDALINLIVYQGDTEFASVEQQRWLFQSAPSEYDRKALTRVMIEEMRHGWQMCALSWNTSGTPEKWKRRRCWSAARSRIEDCSVLSMKTWTTGSTSSPIPTSLTAMANSSFRC